MALTVKEIEALTVNEGKSEREKHDGDGLYLRVKASGSKSWLFRYEFNNERKKIALGPWPGVGLAAAREKADGHRKVLALGKDPKLVAALTEAEQHAKALEAENAEAPVTVRELYERWHEGYLKTEHADGGAWVRGLFELHVFPAGFGELHISLLRGTHVAALMNRVKAKKTPSITKRVLSSFRQMVTWAGPFGWLDGRDPTLGLTAKTFGGKINEGDRYLDAEEITAFAWRLKKCYMVHRWKVAALLVLATGTRSEETVLAERAHFDLKKRRWVIPPENQKQTNIETVRKPHHIHLSEYALKLVRELLAMPGTSKYLLPSSKDPMQPADEKTLSHALGNEMGREQKGRRWTSDLLLEGGPFSAQDLRRTTATQLQELDVNSDIVDRVLNHVETDRIKRTYQKSELRRLMIQAWDKLGAHLEHLTNLPDPEPEFRAQVPLYNSLDPTDPNGEQRLAECRAFNAKRREMVRKLAA